MNKIPIVFERVIKKPPYKVWWGEPIIHLGAHIGIVEDEERSAICWGGAYIVRLHLGNMRAQEIAHV